MSEWIDIQELKLELKDLKARLDELETKTRSMYRTMTWLRGQWRHCLPWRSIGAYKPKISFDRPIGEWQDERDREDKKP